MTAEIKINRKTKEVLISIGKHPYYHRAGLKMALHDIGVDVRRETRRLIRTGSRTGRIYTFRGRPHQASAPGEPPANRSGKLSKSVGFRVRNHAEMVVGESAEYAKFLEDGTRKMDPRPHLIVAVRNKAQDAVNTITENVERQVNE